MPNAVLQLTKNIKTGLEKMQLASNKAKHLKNFNSQRQIYEI
jgi:hypothetical protein